MSFAWSDELACEANPAGHDYEGTQRYSPEIQKALFLCTHCPALEACVKYTLSMEVPPKGVVQAATTWNQRGVAVAGLLKGKVRR